MHARSMGPISKLSTSFPLAEVCLNLLSLLHVDIVSILGADNSDILRVLAPITNTQEFTDRGLLEILHYICRWLSPRIPPHHETSTMSGCVRVPIELMVSVRSRCHSAVTSCETKSSI